jgi:hypothetical protein
MAEKEKEIRLINGKTLTWPSSTPPRFFVNRTRRFVFPVPILEGGGELLVDPNSPKHFLKTNKNGNADRGVVFWNAKDSAWQSARGNGSEAIIINEPTAEQANLLLIKVNALKLLKTITVKDIKAILTYATDDLKLSDHYHKSLKTAMSENRVLDPILNPLFVECVKPTKHKALFIREPFRFQGPVTQLYPHGGILLNDGRFTWGIASDVFQRSFRFVEKDGTERVLQLLSLEFPDA